MKRSRSIRLVLIGSLAAGALAGCRPSNEKPPVSEQNVYTNNYFLPGVGYYHAPFRAWFPLPYNHFDPQTQRYFYGGQWSASACESITNISAPAAGSVQHAEAQRTDVVRGGFGSSSRSHYIHS